MRGVYSSGDCIDQKMSIFAILGSVIVPVRDNWEMSPADLYLLSENIS